MLRSLYADSKSSVGSNDRKIKLENATHPCPRCKKPDTVQLTRYENEWIVFNRRVALPNNMNVRYECNQCKWKNQILPEGDPSDKLTPSDDEDVDYLSATNYMFVGPKTLTNQTASSSNSSISSNSSNSSNLTSKPYSASLYQPSASRSTTSWKQRSLFMKRASCST
ncbi:uncharacterized protein ATC70_000280 [Mucor velutinosus]|uniref:Uncharacterized protein n=1 Tax=Mucor velutinosus TaxID=708070 RepID=A0AAN7I1R8_9FUNG|nr:hypothetical protein ATC70_000280 [Mucor velutinosus]